MHLVTCSGSAFPACCYNRFSMFPLCMSVWVCAVSCTWRPGAGHCRAPIDCSMLSSSPLLCSAATLLPPPTHSLPMNTRGTFNTRRNRGAAGKYSVTDFSVSCIWLGDMTMKTTLHIKIWRICLPSEILSYHRLFVRYLIHRIDQKLKFVSDYYVHFTISTI